MFVNLSLKFDWVFFSLWAGQVSFHLLTICVSFMSLTSLSLVAGFSQLTTWSGYSSPLCAFIEVVSLWLVLVIVIVIGIPGLIAATDFFLCSFKKQIKYLWYEPPQYLPFPFCHLLAKNCGICCYLQGCWSILT